MRPVTVTQSGIGSTRWVVGNSVQFGPTDASFQVTQTGIGIWSIDFTLDDPNTVAAPAVSHPETGLASQSAATWVTTTKPYYAWRLTVASGDNATIVARCLEAGVIN